VVSRSDAIDAAFCRAERTTLTGLRRSFRDESAESSLHSVQTGAEIEVRVSHRLNVSGSS
jgi:hypothetical protein